MVLFGSTLWGLSGTASQQLFQHDYFHTAWLVAVRMLISGMALVIWGTLQKRKSNYSLMKQPLWWPSLLVFAIVGLLGVQYSYFKAIADGNAASATLLQYLGPPLIVAYTALKRRHLPTMGQLGALGLALIGTMLLVTGGNLHHLAVPADAVMWGLISAICLAFYTLYPYLLIRRFGTIMVVGWAMLIGGVASLGIGPVWTWPQGHWSWTTLALVSFVVVFGTLFAFTLYLASLRYLDASETGLLATAEPVSAVLASILFLHVRLDALGALGALTVIAAVAILSQTHSPHDGRLPHSSTTTPN